jgi:hypothetical protein
MTEKPNEAWDLTDMTHPLYDPMKDPTHPFYEADQKEKPGPSDKSAYKVGPGFPPNEHKWKKGCPSPYPKGRPKKVPSMEPELKKIFMGAMNVKVRATKDDKKIILTRLAMGFELLAIQWAKGDRHARRDVFTYAAALGIDLQPKEVIGEALGIDHQTILDTYIRRQRQQHSPPSEPEIRVKAPPDLIDDDVTPPKSDKPDKLAGATAKRKELPETPPEPKPELDKHGRPKPVVRDRAYIEAERERNLAWQKRRLEES